MENKYTREDLELLHKMYLEYTSRYHGLFDETVGGELLLGALEEDSDKKQVLYDFLFKTGVQNVEFIEAPLEDMPLYINGTANVIHYMEQVFVKWRFRIGK